MIHTEQAIAKSKKNQADVSLGLILEM